MAKKVSKKKTSVKMKCSKCNSVIYHSLISDNEYRCNSCGNIVKMKK